MKDNTTTIHYSQFRYKKCGLIGARISNFILPSNELYDFFCYLSKPTRNSKKINKFRL